MKHFIKAFAKLGIAFQCLWALCAAPCAHAADIYYWNPLELSPSNAYWGATNLHWSLTPDQTTNPVAWSNGAIAYFSAGASVPSTNIMVGDTPSIGGLAANIHGAANGSVLLFGNALSLAPGQDVFTGFFTNAADARNYPTVIASPLTGPGQLVLAGVDFFYLMGSNNYSGGTQFGIPGSNSAVTVLFNKNSFGSGPLMFAADSVTLDLTNTGDIVTNPAFFTGGSFIYDGIRGLTVKSVWTLSSNTVFNIQVGLVTLNGPITGPGGITMTTGASSGFLTLGGTNTYTGDTTITSNATINLSGSGSISNTASLRIISGTLNLPVLITNLLSTNTPIVGMGNGTSSVGRAAIT